MPALPEGDTRAFVVKLAGKMPALPEGDMRAFIVKLVGVVLALGVGLFGKAQCAKRGEPRFVQSLVDAVGSFSAGSGRGIDVKSGRRNAGSLFAVNNARGQNAEILILSLRCAWSRAVLTASIRDLESRLSCSAEATPMLTLVAGSSCSNS